MKERKPDLRKLAKRQRWIIWLVLISLLAQFSATLTWGQFSFAVVVALLIVQFAVWVLMIVGVVLVLTAQGNHLLMVVICGILMLAPCGNLLLLLLVNMSVTRTLRRAGLRVHFMGVKDEDVERLLNPALCKCCGYNLTGNVSGQCSECGRPIEHVVPVVPL
jgi:hypothetical protein